ncbi:MAG: endonuclease V, partial [Planctomycetota bacterium]|nr:endonuclease V [Planctomycetota bacterium]
MKVRQFHRWDLTYDEAVAVQRRLAARVRQGPPLGKVETVAGADVSAGRKDELLAAVVVVMRARWPYVPGFLSFREAPVVLEAFRQLKTRPDLVICDGQGRAHPRRLGLASHVGLALGVPTIGCAKSLLVGTVPREPGRRRGGRAPLMDGGERIGTALRTQTGVKPVFVSVGYRIDLASAERWVLAASPRFRLAEPIRAAHRLVTAYKASLGGRRPRAPCVVNAR